MWEFIAPAAANVIAGAFGYAGQRQTNRQNLQIARESMSFAERMRNTEWQAGVADMEAAGINPALAYRMGPASAPGGDTAQMENPAHSALAAMQLQKEMKLIDAQVKKTRSEADTAGAIAERERVRNIAYGFEKLPSGSFKFNYDMPGMLDLVRAEVDTARHGASSAAAVARRNAALANISGLPGGAAERVNRLYPALDYFMNESGKSFQEIMRRMRSKTGPLFEQRN